MTRLWIISDGKPGHLNQSLGLADALRRFRPDWQQHQTAPLKPGQALTSLLRKRWPESVDGEPPALVIGAGHGTHLSLLAAGRAFGARTVLLMKPSLPTGWYDLCLIPAHDRPAQRNNIVTTAGALNRMQPGRPEPMRGMLLIGGPSKHFGWDNGQLIGQLMHICRQSPPDMRWTLTTSRRTPAELLPLLQAQSLGNLEIVPFEQTGPGWLAEQLPRAGQCWVSGDSVSMVYEALSAGCATGILQVPQQANSRIASGLQQLVEQQRVTRYQDWTPGQPLAPPAEPFNEAARCASLILHRWRL
ncbi:mitochondrial fission ELM1 family protein [Marinobacterium arenosum]|uniref:mitochondrial fission ELM1 family protein n=1 Tax=Marinobacterium arenosum TaxID=2862496 RepID=UPI0028F3FC8D|nr:mitochondrial fission ELM1 family protein [Marinobacterium arenosum]